MTQRGTPPAPPPHHLPCSSAYHCLPTRARLPPALLPAVPGRTPITPGARVLRRNTTTPPLPTLPQQQHHQPDAGPPVHSVLDLVGYSTRCTPALAAHTHTAPPACTRRSPLPPVTCLPLLYLPLPRGVTWHRTTLYMAWPCRCMPTRSLLTCGVTPLPAGAGGAHALVWRFYAAWVVLLSPRERVGLGSRHTTAHLLLPYLVPPPTGLQHSTCLPRLSSLYCRPLPLPPCVTPRVYLRCLLRRWRNAVVMAAS